MRKYANGQRVAVRVFDSFEYGVVESYQEGCYRIKVTGFLNRDDTEVSTWYMHLTDEDIALTAEELGFNNSWYG